MGGRCCAACPRRSRRWGSRRSPGAWACTSPRSRACWPPRGSGCPATRLRTWHEPAETARTGSPAGWAARRDERWSGLSSVRLGIVTLGAARPRPFRVRVDLGWFGPRTPVLVDGSRQAQMTEAVRASSSAEAPRWPAGPFLGTCRTRPPLRARGWQLVVVHRAEKHSLGQTASPGGAIRVRGCCCPEPGLRRPSDTHRPHASVRSPAAGTPDDVSGTRESPRESLPSLPGALPVEREHRSLAVSQTAHGARRGT